MNYWSSEYNRVLVCLLGLILGIMVKTTALPATATTKPFTFFPSIGSFSFAQDLLRKREVELMKDYSGVRLYNNSLIMIYHHDLTVAVVELGPQKLLLNCEFIEIYDEVDNNRLLKRLSKINKPLMISFFEMLKLMRQCELVEHQNERVRKSTNEYAGRTEPDTETSNRGLLTSSSGGLTLFSGIVPGTKWCGTGDIAENYADLGSERRMDKCCRAHDLCPKKVKAYQTRYNLENNSIYTKSHCSCDDIFFRCLKRANTTAAQVMGSIYFNVVQVPCFEDNENGTEFRPARKGF